MSVVVGMPAWNEAEGLVEFLTELHDSLQQDNPRFIVIDDRSTDATYQVLDDLKKSGFPVEVHTNERNLGHGPSTLHALKRAVASDPEVVVALDGDGQFRGSDVKRVYDQLVASDVDIVEGVRHSRTDPLYRKSVSFVTRVLVGLRAGSWPKDANTPLRAYQPRVLAALLAKLPDDASTPNPLISALSRQWGLSILEIPVASIPRRGGDPQGSTWKARTRSLPSKRFVRFCVDATQEWITTKA